MTYFVNGLGGKDWRDFAVVVPESRYRFTANYGAMLITSYNDSINFKFYSVPDSLKDDTTFVYQPIGIEPISTVAEKFRLEQNYPNPFNPMTKLKFEIPLLRGVDVPSTRGGRGVLLKVYDAAGKEITVLVDQVLDPGSYEVQWDASAYASGVYFYSLSSSLGTITRKMVLMK